MATNRLDINYLCPYVSSKPSEARDMLEGGDHGYQGFDRHIPAAIDFLAPRVT